VELCRSPAQWLALELGPAGARARGTGSDDASGGDARGQGQRQQRGHGQGQPERVEHAQRGHRQVVGALCYFGAATAAPRVARIGMEEEDRVA